VTTKEKLIALAIRRGERIPDFVALLPDEPKDAQLTNSERLWLVSILQKCSGSGQVAKAGRFPTMDESDLGFHSKGQYGAGLGDLTNSDADE
jgi:hypothetical protein